jgi:nucleotide-binding universal stress UspA family protein
MNSLDIQASDWYAPHQDQPIQRLLFMADAAVADVEALPPAVRATFDAAAAVYVLTPTLPGRLAWITDDVDRVRHVADERLDVVLEHMRSIGVDAHGLAGRGSVLTVLADAVAACEPDHILIALRGSQHANWQERGLIEHVEQRFGLPVTTYAVDLEGHASSATGPLLLCYDGSEDAKHALRRAGALFSGSKALVLTVWQSAISWASVGWAGEAAGMVDFVAIDRAASEEGTRLAEEGAQIAQDAGVEAEPVTVQSTGSVWERIIEVADHHDAAAIVMGSRGLSGVRAMLLGSVSNAVVHHAARPALVIPRADHDDEA